MSARPGWTSDSQTVLGRLVHHVRSEGDQPAFIVLKGDATTTLSWDGLLRASVGYARRYEAEGVRRGDTVLLCLPHGETLYPAFLGVMLLGAVPGFLAIPSHKQDPKLYWAAHEAMLQRIRPRLLMTYDGLDTLLGDVAPAETMMLVDPGIVESEGSVDELVEPYADLDPDTVALLQHSSGTTGLKKGVALTSRQIAAQIRSLDSRLEISENDRITSWLPVYHDMGLLSSFLAPIHLGICVVSLDAFEWVAEPQLVLEAMDRHRGTITWMPNFAFNHLVRSKTGDETYRLDHVRAFINASEPCKPATFERFLDAFSSHGVRRDQLQILYGLAEAVFGVSQTRPGDVPVTVWLDASGLDRDVAIVAPPGPKAREYLSNGRPLDGIEVRVDAQPSSEGVAVGELQVRGEFVFDGYNLDPEATAKVFDGEWCRTGDIGCVIDSRVYVLGRIKDIIIHHGVNFFAHDIEAAVTAVPGVKKGRCVAVAVFDPEVGSEAIEVIAERDPDLPREDRELEDAIRRGVSDLFPVVLAKVHLCDPGWMVKTTSGKVSRSENLVKLGRAQSPSPVEVAEVDPSDTAATVLNTIATTFFVDVATLSRETVAGDVNGWDSLGHTVLMLRLSRALGSKIPESVAARASNVGNLIDLIEEHRAKT